MQLYLEAGSFVFLGVSQLRSPQLSLSVAEMAQSHYGAYFAY